MYLAMLIGLMLAFPVASVVIEVLTQDHAVLEAAVVGKWFVFWAVGDSRILPLAAPAFAAYFSPRQ
jgi:hypothetical protein